MAFIQASASLRERHDTVLSADNGQPERHILIDTLRQAAPLMGLKAPVVATLDALLSCLPPKRQHNTVFASNATLTFRRNGITDRTLRRHVAILQDLGLLERRDSANRKRFCKRNTAEGIALRFGFDLTPLFQRFSEISRLAAAAAQEQEEIGYLKTKIRAAANKILGVDPESVDATHALRTLRRKLTIQDCEVLLELLNADEFCTETTLDRETNLSVNNGQNVRHHHSSKKELKDKQKETIAESSLSPVNNHDISVDEVVTTCTNAAEFAPYPIRSMKDVISHAQTLAPMLGINSRTYHAAQEHIGHEKAALTVWAIMQFHDRIKAIGAYFQSLTCGQHSKGFSPEALIRRMSRTHSATA